MNNLNVKRKLNWDDDYFPPLNLPEKKKEDPIILDKIDFENEDTIQFLGNNISFESAFTSLSFESDEYGSPFKVQNSTPEKIIKFQNVIHKNSFTDSLLKNEKEISKEALIALQNLNDSPKSKKKAVKISVIALQLLEKMGIKNIPSTEEEHQKATKKLKTEDEWVMPIYAKLMSMYSRCKFVVNDTLNADYVIDIDHISSQIVDSEMNKVKNTGFHFCPENHSFRKCLIDKREHPGGVFSAWWTLQEKSEPKFSSFWPDSIKNTNMLIEMIQNSAEISKSGNRTLRSSRDGKIHFEMYSEGALLVKTAFPVFCLETYQANKTYQIYDKFSLSAKEVLRESQRVVAEYFEQPVIDANNRPVKYVLGDEGNRTLVIDLAPLYEKQTKIKHGMLFSIPENHFNKEDLLDLYDEMKLKKTKK